MGHDMKCGAAAKRKRHARKFRACLLTVKERRLSGQENEVRSSSVIGTVGLSRDTCLVLRQAQDDRVT